MTAITDFVSFEVNGNVGVITVDNPPVNALSVGVRAGIKGGRVNAGPLAWPGQSKHRTIKGDVRRDNAMKEEAVLDRDEAVKERREFLKRVGTAAAVAPAVALLLSASVVPRKAALAYPPPGLDFIR